MILFNDNGDFFMISTTHIISFVHRFYIRCEPGQLLSYSVIEFQLEEESTCSGRYPVCVDWVDHHTLDSHRLCGIREPNTVYSDGSNEMHIEFVSNRRSQSKGFQYFVTCIDPRFDINAANAEDDDDEDIKCNSPSGAVHETNATLVINSKITFNNMYT